MMDEEAIEKWYDLEKEKLEAEFLKSLGSLEQNENAAAVYRKKMARLRAKYDRKIDTLLAVRRRAIKKST